MIFSDISHGTRAVEGVGCLTNETLEYYIIDWNARSERLLAVQIKDQKTNPIKSIILVGIRQMNTTLKNCDELTTETEKT